VKIFLVVFLTVATLLLGAFEYNRRIQVNKIKKLQAEVGHLKEFKEKEKRIFLMEEAMQVCFDVSEFEAHYYCILYDDFATKYGIPWEIYPSIIRIESNFNPTLKSNMGARGIAQVMENTGKEVADKIGIIYEPAITLWNDLLCQIIGFTYLSEAIKEKGLDDGVKVYLGGPGFDTGRKDIGQYRTTVRKEFDRLSYVYKGVLYDSLQRVD